MMHRHALVTGLASVLAAAAVAPAMAQQPAPSAGSSSGGLEEIVVTARKMSENLSDAPLSITAFSAADIEAKGFTSLEDVSRVAPGVQYSSQGGQQPGRYKSAIRFRGMNVNSDSPSMQLGALFIDGVYVLGGTHSIPYDDVERIEVIRGPQSATYGRSTFGGAINYITRNPSLTDMGGQFSASGANFGESDVSASFEAPLIDERLAVRIGGRYYARGRVKTSGDGGALGEESSKSVQLTLLAKPQDALQIKLRAFHGMDEDGPPLGGMIQGWRNDSCTGRTVNTQDPAAPVARPTLYICGTVPEEGVAVAGDLSNHIINSPTSLITPRAVANGTPNILIDHLVRRGSPAHIDVPAIDHVGLVRTVTRLTLSADYSFDSGYSISAVAAQNELKSNWIRAFGITPLGYYWSRDPEDSEDESFELRVNSPTDRKFTWVAGVNYYEQQYVHSGIGGDTVSLCQYTTPMALGSPCSGRTAVGDNNPIQATDRVTDVGFFASLNYAFSDQWSLSVEGRYQEDETTTAVFTTSPSVLMDKSVQPRAILRFKPVPATTLYASFAKGVLPGVINGGVAKATPRELAQYRAQFPTIQATVEGDRLDMFELGWKQQFLDRRAALNAAIYYGKWENQKGRSTFVIHEDCGSFSHGATVANGCPNGPTGLPAMDVVTGAPTLNSRNANVAGDSTLSGLELDGRFLVTDRLELSGTFTYAKTEYDDYIFNYVQRIAGFIQMKGNANARFPEFMGSLDANYELPISGDWNWYVNGSVSYFGKTFVDESNLATCKDYTLVNGRFGAERGDVRIEGFVRNLFDNDSWSACARWSDFDAAPSGQQLTQYQGVAVSQLVPRQVGVRAVWKF